MSRVVHLFREVDMRNQHAGLISVAAKAKVRVDQLGLGEHAVFLNKALDKIKVFSANSVLSYYKTPGGGRLNLNMIEYIPVCFGATGFDWGKAERFALDKLLAIKTKPRKNSLPVLAAVLALPYDKEKT